MNSNELVDNYFVIDRAGTIRLLTEAFLDRFSKDNYFSLVVAIEGHVGYDNYDHMSLLYEIEDLNLVDRAIEMGLIATESAL